MMPVFKFCGEDPMNSPQSEARWFDENYFRHGCGQPYERSPEWLQHFARIAERIVRDVGPRTVLDAGCAMGFLVEALREHGVEAFGIDISEYAIKHVRDDLKPYCRLGSVSDPLPQRYDLVVCIEVLEHLPKLEAEKAIESFCTASDDILFSSTPLDYREATHFNVQPLEYWAEQFARHGFVRDVDFDASFITPWAARFRRRLDPLPRILRDYERRFWLVWKENQDLRNTLVETRDQLADKDQQLRTVVDSTSWRLIQELGRSVQSLAPPRSRRERWLQTGVDALRRMLVKIEKS
jgi:SAM-dependent methyltransferase